MVFHTEVSLDSSSRSATEEQTPKQKTSRRKWLVLLSGFIIMAILVGFVFNMSILISELMRTFGKQKSETALVQSITMGILYTAGAVSGKCLFRYGVRSTGIIGSILVSLGLILSFFANNIPHLIATIGVVSGFGSSAVYISAVTSIGEYFEEDSKLALSFLTFGSGCGCMVIPFLFHRFIEEFGWRGSLLILGGLMANAICGFAICKPVKIGPPSTTHEPNERNTETNSKQESYIKSLRSVISNKVYLTHVVALCCTLPVINSFLTFFIDFLEIRGFDSETAVLLYLYSQLGMTISGILPGLCEKYIYHCSDLLLSAFFTMIGSIAFALLPNGETYAHYLVLVIILGMTVGVSVTTISMTTLKLVGILDYSAAMGVLMTAMGISNTISAPIAGLFIDLTGSYTKPLYGMSASLGFATCMLVFAAALKRKISNNNNSENES